MPTGYTADVQDGKITTLAEFAMQCARAFGACIEMRDAPANAPIPDEFKPSGYHDKALADAEAELARLEDMPIDQQDAACKADFASAMQEHKRRSEEKETVRRRYEAMIEKVKAWTPPTPDHLELKSFMLSQLKDSIGWDCRPSDPPPQRKRSDWYADALKSARWNVNYHAEQMGKDTERARSRTEWVRKLRESLEATPCDRVQADGKTKNGQR